MIKTKTYAKIKKVPKSDPTDAVASTVVGKGDYEKVNYFSVNKVKTKKLSSVNKEETDPKIINAEKITSCPSEYFDNLVSIIQKAVQDLDT